MKTFYIVRVVENNRPKAAIDCPKNLPIPDTNDELTIVDIKGVEHTGIVSKKEFRIRTEYREVTIILNCG